MDVNQFAEQIMLRLPYEPNRQQVQLIAALAHFCSNATPSDSAFILAGYAGTGKTSLCGALVAALRILEIPVVLMAPTGRAAKVFASFAHHPATTIHHRIYRPDNSSGAITFSGDVADNPYNDAFFIVDEASMIPNESADNPSGFSSNLLADLIHYVYSGQNCKLILIGDTAQLPPVGCPVSPALNPATLRGFGLRVTRAQLTAIARQQAKSGILYNATLIRNGMASATQSQTNPAISQQQLPVPKLYARNFSDVRFVPSYDLSDTIASSYSNVGIENTLLITRSNKRAVNFNLAIRNTILDREEELISGERLMVVKNNYLFSAKIKNLDFIANGDMVTLKSIIATEHKYGMRFADAVVNLSYRDIDVPCKIILDTLTSESPSLTQQESENLFNKIVTDPDLFSASTPMRTRIRQMRSNPYFNALQMKYAYAVTCHKAQGGQWDDIFVDMAGIAPEAFTTLDFHRWLYTAITRATQKIYFANPPQILCDMEID